MSLSPPGTLAGHSHLNERIRPGSSLIFARRSLRSRSRPTKSSSNLAELRRCISCMRSSESSPDITLGPVLNFTRSHGPSGRCAEHTHLACHTFSIACRWYTSKTWHVTSPSSIFAERSAALYPTSRVFIASSLRNLRRGVSFRMQARPCIRQPCASARRRGRSSATIRGSESASCRRASSECRRAWTGPTR